MNISVVGTGYVGLVCGAGFAEMGNNVVCVDSDAEKIARLRNGEVPIYESGLEELIRRGVKNHLLRFTDDAKDAIADSDVCFIAVGTPMGESGDACLDAVFAVAREIGACMNGYLCVVDKSTVPVGTADRVRTVIREELDKRNAAIEFDVVSNPEFLKMGAAVADFMRPDRVIVGSDSDRAASIMRDLYAPFIHNHDRMQIMDIRSAEMTKYAANAMLANRISFINEIAAICEKVGADVNKVRLGIGSDPRIGYHFLYPGCGYGGSCFPKDIRALISTAEEYGCDTPLLRAVEAVNQRQKNVVGDKVIRRFGSDLRGKTFAVWGLAFKPGTDDMRESSSLQTIRRLTDLGAVIRAYDPKAMSTARNHYLNGNAAVTYAENKYDALNGADALLLLTEWKEFRTPDFQKMKKRLTEPLVFDGRNMYDAEKMMRLGFEYHQIGVAQG